MYKVLRASRKQVSEFNIQLWVLIIKKGYCVKKLILLALFLIIPIGAWGDGKWEASRYIDPTTDEDKCLLSCLLCDKNLTQAAKTFVSINKSNDAGSMNLVVGFQGGHTAAHKKGYFTVDKYKTIASDGQHYSEELAAHLFESNVDVMIEQMKAGRLLRISHGGEIFEISLMGFTKAFNEFLECK